MRKYEEKSFRVSIHHYSSDFKHSDYISPIFSSKEEKYITVKSVTFTEWIEDWKDWITDEDYPQEGFYHKMIIKLNIDSFRKQCKQDKRNWNFLFQIAVTDLDLSQAEYKTPENVRLNATEYTIIGYYFKNHTYLIEFIEPVSEWYPEQLHSSRSDAFETTQYTIVCEG